MQTDPGPLDCPHCGGGVSTGQLLMARGHKVQCRRCGVKLFVSGEFKSVLFGEMLIYVALVVPYIVFPDHLTLDILMSLLLMVGCYYISMRMFYKVHPIKSDTTNVKAS